MDLFVIVLVAITLGFDSFAVSVSSGLAYQKITFFEASKIALTLAFFQTMMPFAGWVFGEQIKLIIEPYDHWIAFIILLILGIKMIKEVFKQKEERNFNPLDPLTLLSIAIATSIDALAVGFTFSIIELSIFVAGFIIGAVTYFLSMLGILIGKKMKIKNSQILEVIGGLILIGLGTKILIEHQF